VKAFLNILLDFGRPYAYPDQKVPVKAVLKRKKRLGLMKMPQSAVFGMLNRRECGDAALSFFSFIRVFYFKLLF
jgi:hypothetical protein